MPPNNILQRHIGNITYRRMARACASLFPDMFQPGGAFRINCWIGHFWMPPCRHVSFTQAILPFIGHEEL